MKTLPLTAIIIPNNRQRRKVSDEHIGRLMGSIFLEDGPGLINPITLREGETLVAGECRVRAISLGYKMGKVLRHAGEVVPAGHVPFIDFGELTALQQMEAEYVENAIREDLPWQDNVQAMAALHALREAQAAARGQKQTFRDTAKEVYKEVDPSVADTVSKAVQLSKMMNNPLISKASSMTEAMKVMRKVEDGKNRERLAALTGKVAVADRMRVFHADCLTWMKEQPSEQYDVILTDPPYGMDADAFGDGAGRLRGTTHEYEDDEAGTMKLLSAAIPEFYRLANPQAHLYLWCDIDLFPWLREVCREAGWWVHRTPLINLKKEGGRVPWPEHGPRRCYELCLYAVKGKKRTTAIFPDVFESKLAEGNFGHGAQKPVEAYVELLKRSTKPGDRVLDAFAGTGTIFVAAHELNLYADGVEMEAAAYGTCIKRIGGLK